MGIFVKGEVIVIPFPFSDLSRIKRRPALVIKPLTGDDIILCQITAKQRQDQYSVSISSNDFDQGSLHQNSFVRTNRLFTADSNIIIKSVGTLKNNKTSEVITRIIKLIQS
ncbi:MAG: type II toxin-antitoxin system PemK/MazF family toxin [Bacteroidetes bacterium]|nr:type II toxin-antitoxin system PemK/MazF family toxin [Bacteroidota bacterium]